MMEYKGIDKWNKPDVLQHWKYIDKIKVGNTWRYFYSQAELDAFRNGSQVVTGFKDIVRNGLNFFKPKNKPANNTIKKKNPIDFVKNFFTKKTKDVSNASKSVKDFVSNLFKSEEQKEQERLEKEKQKKRDARIKAEKYTIVDKNGSEDGHKYLYKIKIGDKFRYFYTEDEYQAYAKRLDYVKNEPDFMLDVPRSDLNYTRDEDMILVNPKFGEAEDYYINCTECSLIYELRRRGYDVESNGIDGSDYAGRYNMDDRFDYLAENAKSYVVDIGTGWEGEGDDEYDYSLGKHSKKYIDEYKRKVNEVFDSMPNGSRGDFSCNWDDYGGHSMVWEKDSDGKVTIYDSQLSGRGKTYTHDIEFIAQYSWQPRITRTDNLVFKDEIKNIFMERTTELSENKTRTDVDVEPRRRH